MKTSISDYSEYRNFCKEAAIRDEVYASFRTVPVYTTILEHVSHELGERYCQWIENAWNFTPERLDLARKNDTEGSAMIVDYHAPFTQVCPSTMRYLKVALELEQLFGSLQGKNVIEIGVGYGGQCKLIKSLWDVQSYTLVDLPEPLELSKRYLHDVDNCHFKTLEELSDDKTYDVVISNYAFSECERSIQEQYLNKVLFKSHMGYVTYNNICHLFNVESLSREEFCKMIPCDVLGETPQSGDNLIFYWGKTQ